MQILFRSQEPLDLDSMRSRPGHLRRGNVYIESAAPQRRGAVGCLPVSRHHGTGGLSSPMLPPANGGPRDYRRFSNVRTTSLRIRL